MNAQKRLALWFVIILFVAAAFPALNDTMYYTPDSANYLGWAKSLASFDGFKLTYAPEPSRYVINSPLYSVLLTPVALVCPLDPVAAKALTVMFGALLLWVLHRYVSQRTGYLAAFLGVVLLATNAQTLLYATQVLSDIPFAAGMIIVFLLVDRITADGNPGTWSLVGLIAVLTATVLLREIGTALLLAVTLFFLLRREYVRAGVIFLIPVIVLLLWYVRNEVLVGNIELPELRNSKLFFSNALTENGAGLLREFQARIASNASAYVHALGNLLFQSGTSGWTFNVVDYRDGALTFLSNASGTLLFIGAPLTLMIAAFGLHRLWTSVRNGRLFIYFLFFYAAIVLLYPIIDNRFMYPVLVLLILCAALTIQHVINWTVARETSQQKFLVAGFSLLMVLLLIPNFIWGRNFISTALAYRSAPENLFVSTASFDQYPAEYTKGIREACNWISAQNTNGMRVISRYQQAGLWLGEGEVIVFGPLVAPGVFDDVARYYNAGYVLALSQKNQMRDFEYQMASSTRFWFETVYRRGDAEVLRIHRAPSANAVPGSMDSDSSGAQRTRFLRAMREMGQGNYTSARGGFEQLTESPGFAAPATFYSAIAAEFSGDMPGARKLLLHLGTFPQAGPYLVQTRVHQDIIAFLDSARTALSPADKAWYYHSVSVSYWMMGFRRQAEEVLARCVASDPSYFLGPMFSILYLLQRNDIATARLYYTRAEALRPGDTLVATLRNLIALTDSARTAPSPRTGSRFRTELGRNYQFLGLNDFAADQFATAVELDSANTTALHHLADIHILKKRYYPAALTLSAWVQREPSNATAQEKLRAIMARLR